MEKLKVFTDGASRGNPGLAGAGVYFPAHGGYHRFLGEATNNVAEYSAVILALEKAKEFGAKEVEMYMDSKLVAEQLSGRYKVKNKNLARFFLKIWNLSHDFRKISYQHIPREENARADAMANEAIDNYLKNR